MCVGTNKNILKHIYLFTMRSFKDKTWFLCIYFLFISEHTFLVYTWNIWICLPVFIKSNRSKTQKRQSFPTHCLLWEVAFLSCPCTLAATETFVLWIVHICVTHVSAFRDWMVPAWRKHAEQKLRETGELGIQPDPRGQLSSASASGYCCHGVFNAEHSNLVPCP